MNAAPRSPVASLAHVRAYSTSHVVLHLCYACPYRVSLHLVVTVVAAMQSKRLQRPPPFKASPCALCLTTPSRSAASSPVWPKCTTILLAACCNLPRHPSVLLNGHVHRQRLPVLPTYRLTRLTVAEVACGVPHPLPATPPPFPTPRGASPGRNHYYYHYH